LDNTPIQLLDPSKKPEKPELHLVTSLMPAIIMFVLVVVLRGIMSTNMGTYVIFSICSMGLGLFTSIAGIVQGQNDYKKRIKTRETVYREYIEKKEDEIKTARETELHTLEEIYYSPVKGVEKVLSFDSDCFDRIPSDDDFLDVFLGTGRKISGRQIDCKDQEQLEEGDELSQMPEEIRKKYMYIEGAPISLRLRDAGAVGIVGDEGGRYQFFKYMVADLASRQFHNDVVFYLLIGEDKDKYQWIKRLPQLQPGGVVRNIVFNSETKAYIFDELFKELTTRSENKSHRKHIIVFVMDDNGLTNHPLSRFVERAASLQTTFVFFEEKIDYLPLHCTSIIELNGSHEGKVYNSSDSNRFETFSYELLNDSKMEAFVNKIAPVRSEEISLESTLRKSITMFEMLGIYAASDIDITKNWASSKVFESMAAPLGVNSKDEIVYLDLHEKAHGPHGLVAGTTGSGKSEILQSYILSCALRFHPYEIGFVIIDFKGGGMANQFKDLPHLIGAITNIDGKEIDRSLKSIKAELLRRQECFAEAGVNNIDKYIQMYKNGSVKIPIPHLVIIVDEFAELKAEQPEFMKELISAARIGRSLGVHLILATQKPAGQVNEQIWSNSKFKLCLKVQDQQDSKEVIKSPLAAEIKEPGRAYLQVGNNEIFELFQSAYSGGPSVREDLSSKKKFSIYKYGLEGRRGILFEQKPEKKAKAVNSELEALVAQVNEYCNENKIDKLPNICLPSLETIYAFDGSATYEDYMQVPVGIYDDPDHQYQGTVSFDFGRDNTIIVGSAQMGKTNLLQIVIRYLTEHNSPQKINFYIMDFGSMILKSFENLRQVGGVVIASEDEKINNLFKLLMQEIELRKNKLMNAGVSSYYAYCDAGFTDIPQICLIIDNYTAFKELYMDKHEQSFMILCRDGLSLGISVIMTNASTSGIGYRHLANFANRICLTCNETSDYGALLSRCKIEPEPVPGRILFQKEKTIYEAQTYLAFEGQKEIDRVNSIRSFIDRMNDSYDEYGTAKPIPCIPNVLTWKELKNQVHDIGKNNSIPLGLDFATIDPVYVDLKEELEFAVMAKKQDMADAFVERFLKHVSICSGGKAINIYIMDSLERKLNKLKEFPNTQRYCIEASESELVLDSVLDSLRENKQMIMSGDGEGRSINYNIVIVNSRDAIDYVSSTAPVLSKFKEIITEYKNMGVLFIYSMVENAAVAYNGPEILKRIKENKKVLFMDNLSKMKLFDLSPSAARTYTKELLADEGYWINGTEIMKVKLISD
jgi:S-DNA-T family DNA segregation ATPase FtsK/SpoIIIE